jgi:hypothetical protein
MRYSLNQRKTKKNKIKKKNKNKRTSNKKQKIKYGGSDLPMNYISFSLEQSLAYFNNLLQQFCNRNDKILYLSVVRKDDINALCLNIMKPKISMTTRSNPLPYDYVYSCISQINLDLDENALVIDSKTQENFQRYNLNTLLRALVVLLGNKIEPNARYLMSYPSNYVSAYSLISKLNGIPYDENGNKMNISMLKTVEDYARFYKEYQIKEQNNYVVPIYDVRVDFGYRNMKIAYDIFMSKITCDVLNL